MLRGYSCIGLDNPKNTINVGAVFRAAKCYQSAFVALTGSRMLNKLGGVPTDTQRAVRHIPILRVSDLKTVIPFNCVPVAVDLIEGAIPLPEYTHPERAFYIFGAEDNTLGERVTSWCRDTVCVPTNGCMNLAATVNVILYDRMMKVGYYRQPDREDIMTIEQCNCEQAIQQRKDIHIIARSLQLLQGRAACTFWEDAGKAWEILEKYGYKYKEYPANYEDNPKRYEITKKQLETPRKK